MELAELPDTGGPLALELSPTSNAKDNEKKDQSWSSIKSISTSIALISIVFVVANRTGTP